MLVISGEIRVAPESRGKMIEQAIIMAQATRTEAGCHAYSFYTDIEDPNVLRIFEEWESDAALAAHFKAPHMAAYRAATKGLTVISRALKKYEIASASPL